MTTRAPLAQVDFVVHSMKDLPTSLPNGMVIGAVLERQVWFQDDKDNILVWFKNGAFLWCQACHFNIWTMKDPRDAVILKKGSTVNGLQSLHKGAVVSRHDTSMDKISQREME